MNAISSLVRTAKKETRKTKHARLSSVAASCDDRKVAKPVRVNGPYRDRDSWRIYLIDESGRKSMLFDTREAAEAMKARLSEQARTLIEKTVGESLDDYRDYRIKVRGVLPLTAEEHCRHLRDLLPLDLPIASLTSDKAHRFYVEYSERPNRHTGKPIAVATHQWVLLIGKCWGRWLVKSKICATNPFASVESMGKPNAGKPQLTRDESHRLSHLALDKARAGHDWAVGVLLMLHLGLRQGEVAARVARDVDTEGKVLIIPFGKTSTSKRRLKVAGWLQPFLRTLAAGRPPSDLLWPANGGKQRPRQYWWSKVHELCRAAGVPEVCPHSLRGLHATLAIEEGASSEAVARALGHTSFEMTAKHYASADSVANARVARASETLDPSDPKIISDRIGNLLAELSTDELAELRRRLVA